MKQQKSALIYLGSAYRITMLLTFEMGWNDLGVKTIECIAQLKRTVLVIVIKILKIRKNFSDFPEF